MKAYRKFAKAESGQWMIMLLLVAFVLCFSAPALADDAGPNQSQGQSQQNQQGQAQAQGQQQGQGQQQSQGQQSTNVNQNSANSTSNAASWNYLNNTGNSHVEIKTTVPPYVMNVPATELPTQYAGPERDVALTIYNVKTKKFNVPYSMLVALAKSGVEMDKIKVVVSGDYAYVYALSEAATTIVDPNQVLALATVQVKNELGTTNFVPVDLNVYQRNIKFGWGLGGQVGGGHTEAESFRSTGLFAGLIPAFAKAYTGRGVLIRAIFKIDKTAPSIFAAVAK